MNLATLAIFAFGALTFSVLSIYYWRERLSQTQPRKPSAFPVFTLVCAAAFLNSLLLEAISLEDAGSGWAGRLILAGRLIVALLPPLILHLVYELESPGLRARGVWKGTLIAFYAVSIAAVWSDTFSAALLLAIASAAGLVLPVFSRRPLRPGDRAHRRWIRALLALMLLSETASLFGLSPLADQAPDYLLLAFFCVSLYYRERLVFFDVLVKRGVFFAVGLFLLTLAVAIGRSWIYPAAMLAFWLLSPWVNSQVSRAVDHLWLRRPYSAPDAEFHFFHDIQAAASEDDLRQRAAASLSAIFRTNAEVEFGTGSNPTDGGLAIPLAHNGSLLLAPRPNGIPFLSDDRKLLESLAGAFAVVLENVRFRADLRRQEEREQKLRLLASRAELKALRAQINPHFLFNALSVIAGLLHYRPELADETIEQLAQVFRYTLRKSENDWTPLSEEVDFIRAYLRVEQARFGDRLQLEFDVAPDAAQVHIPAMSIQPLIENAIKHGISAIAGRGTVALRARLEGGCLSVEVSDNGPGFPAGFSLDDPGEGHGLRNVTERLRVCYGDAARLCWECGRSGTRVALTIPRVASSGLTGENARNARSGSG